MELENGRHSAPIRVRAFACKLATIRPRLVFLMRRPVRVKHLSLPSGLFATRYATARFAFAAARRPPAPRLVLRRSRFPPTLIPRQAPDAAQLRRALATRPAPLRAPLSRLASAAAPPQVLPAATRTATSAAAVLGRSKSPAAP